MVLCSASCVLNVTCYVPASESQFSALQSVSVHDATSVFEFSYAYTRDSGLYTAVILNICHTDYNTLYSDLHTEV
jgi:hypothetical protein